MARNLPGKSFRVDFPVLLKLRKRKEHCMSEKQVWLYRESTLAEKENYHLFLKDPVLFYRKMFLLEGSTEEQALNGALLLNTDFRFTENTECCCNGDWSISHDLLISKEVQTWLHMYSVGGKINPLALKAVRSAWESEYPECLFSSLPEPQVSDLDELSELTRLKHFSLAPYLKHYEDGKSCNWRKLEGSVAYLCNRYFSICLSAEALLSIPDPLYEELTGDLKSDSLFDTNMPEREDELPLSDIKKLQYLVKHKKKVLLKDLLLCCIAGLSVLSTLATYCNGFANPWWLAAIPAVYVFVVLGVGLDQVLDAFMTPRLAGNCMDTYLCWAPYLVKDPEGRISISLSHVAGFPHVQLSYGTEGAVRYSLGRGELSYNTYGIRLWLCDFSKFDLTAQTVISNDITMPHDWGFKFFKFQYYQKMKWIHCVITVLMEKGIPVTFDNKRMSRGSCTQHQWNKSQALYVYTMKKNNFKYYNLHCAKRFHNFCIQAYQEVENLVHRVNSDEDFYVRHNVFELKIAEVDHPWRKQWETIRTVVQRPFDFKMGKETFDRYIADPKSFRQYLSEQKVPSSKAKKLIKDCESTKAFLLSQGLDLENPYVEQVTEKKIFVPIKVMEQKISCQAIVEQGVQVHHIAKKMLPNPGVIRRTIKETPKDLMVAIAGPDFHKLDQLGRQISKQRRKKANTRGRGQPHYYEAKAAHGKLKEEALPYINKIMCKMKEYSEGLVKHRNLQDSVAFLFFEKVKAYWHAKLCAWSVNSPDGLTLGDTRVRMPKRNKLRYMQLRLSAL